MFERVLGKHSILPRGSTQTRAARREDARKLIEDRVPPGGRDEAIELRRRRRHVACRPQPRVHIIVGAAPRIRMLRLEARQADAMHLRARITPECREGHDNVKARKGSRGRSEVACAQLALGSRPRIDAAERADVVIVAQLLPHRKEGILRLLPVTKAHLPFAHVTMRPIDWRPQHGEIRKVRAEVGRRVKAGINWELAVIIHGGRLVGWLLREYANLSAARGQIVHALAPPTALVADAVAAA